MCAKLRAFFQFLYSSSSILTANILTLNVYVHTLLPQFFVFSIPACEWVGKQIKKCFSKDEGEDGEKGTTSSRRCGQTQKQKMAADEGKVYHGLEDNSYEYGG